jgi:hypothetical protein
MTQGLSQHTNLYPPDQKSECASHAGANQAIDVRLLLSLKVRRHVIVRNPCGSQSTRHVSD